MGTSPITRGKSFLDDLWGNSGFFGKLVYVFAVILIVCLMILFVNWFGKWVIRKYNKCRGHNPEDDKDEENEHDIENPKPRDVQKQETPKKRRSSRSRRNRRSSRSS